MVNFGAACFGLVIGWVAYRTLRRSGDKVGLSDIATVIGAVGGAAVTQLFDNQDLFAWYCVGLAAGFFLYFIVALILEGKAGVTTWMADRGTVDGNPGGTDFGRPR